MCICVYIYVSRCVALVACFCNSVTNLSHLFPSLAWVRVTLVLAGNLTILKHSQPLAAILAHCHQTDTLVLRRQSRLFPFSQFNPRQLHCAFSSVKSVTKNCSVWLHLVSSFLLLLLLKGRWGMRKGESFVKRFCDFTQPKEIQMTRLEKYILQSIRNALLEYEEKLRFLQYTFEKYTKKHCQRHNGPRV